jgi:hypothetical protein
MALKKNLEYFSEPVFEPAVSGIEHEALVRDPVCVVTRLVL